MYKIYGYSAAGCFLALLAATGSVETEGMSLTAYIPLAVLLLGCFLVATCKALSLWEDEKRRRRRAERAERIEKRHEA